MVSIMSPIAEVGSTQVVAERVSAVADLVRVLVGEATPTPAAWDDPLYWNVEAPRQDRCQFLAIGNAINFRFWSITDNYLVPAEGFVAGRLLRGSMYMWRRLRLALQRGDLALDAAFLASLDVPRFRRAFEADDGSFPLEPGVEDRVENLCDLGTRLSEHWEGQFGRVVEQRRARSSVSLRCQRSFGPSTIPCES
jgi:hypothetical protein